MVQDIADRSAEGTRARILDAALELFGERGLDRRDGARHRRSRKGQRRRHLLSFRRQGRALPRRRRHGHGRHRGPRARAAPPHSWTSRRPMPLPRITALEKLAETVVDVIVGPPEMRRVARFIIREQMQPTCAFEILFGDVRAAAHGGDADCSAWPPASTRSGGDAAPRLPAHRPGDLPPDCRGGRAAPHGARALRRGIPRRR